MVVCVCLPFVLLVLPLLFSAFVANKDIYPLASFYNIWNVGFQWLCLYCGNIYHPNVCVCDCQDNAHVGDAFMNQVQSFAAYIPYMTCPGNHESA